MENLKEKLKSEVDQADWDMLAQHHQQGTVFIVSGGVGLLDVAVAIAQDKTDFVKIWLDSGNLARPSDQEVSQFKKNRFEKMCDFIIIQPYVLICLLN